MTGPLPPQVRRLADDDARLEACPPDPPYASTVIERVLADEWEDCLHAAAQDRWVKANTYAYDAARKAVEAWLLAHGFRVRAAPGAHAAVVEVVHRWLSGLDPPGPRLADSFAVARKARHDDEYPHPRARERSARELRPLVLDSLRIVEQVAIALGLSLSLPPLPTDTTLAARPERQPGPRPVGPP